MKVSSNELCNGCAHLNFKTKNCEKYNAALNTFVNREGYVSVFPCTACERFDYTPRERSQISK